MDEDAIRKAGVKPLREVLKEITDMFPINETELYHRPLSATERSDEFSDVIEYLQKLGVSALISTGVGADGMLSPCSLLICRRSFANLACAKILEQIRTLILLLCKHHLHTVSAFLRKTTIRIVTY